MKHFMILVSNYLSRSSKVITGTNQKPVCYSFYISGQFDNEPIWHHTGCRAYGDLRSKRHLNTTSPLCYSVFRVILSEFTDEPYTSPKTEIMKLSDSEDLSFFLIISFSHNTSV